MGKTPKQLYLWHESGLTDPKTIYDSLDGFNTQFAIDDGLWGRGIYFAANASYSSGDSRLKG